MTDFQYVGSELEIFAHAKNWKTYVRATILRYLAGEVLEVGAGIGAATQIFYDGSQQRWVCLEPDAKLADEIPVQNLPHPERCQVRSGTLPDLGAEEHFDCIVYMDVLEHIEDDSGELRQAATHLKPSGHLVVLSPAMPWLFTEFDSRIGHYRRYTKATLRGVAPGSLEEQTCRYLDSMGVLASLGNRLLLHSSTPRKSQILMWDRFLVPVSRFVDPVLASLFGRSILGIWKKPAP